jgi:DNA-3-methyladenine glycosylase I
MTDQTTRCAWADTDPLLAKYHDDEWGRVEHDDRKLFEMLNLEGAQAGLSWLTVLKKRDNYRVAFDDFDAARIANYTTAKRTELLANPGIIRNRLKVNAFIENAKAYLEVQREYGSFDAYIWSFTEQRGRADISTEQRITLSEKMSKALKKRGFRFVGPTICYAFMQAIGMIDDHSQQCYLHA